MQIIELEDENKWKIYLDNTVFSSVQKLFQDNFIISGRGIYVLKCINIMGPEIQCFFTQCLNTLLNMHFYFCHWRKLFPRFAKYLRSVAFEGREVYSLFRQVSSKISIGPWLIRRISVRELNGHRDAYLARGDDEASVSYNHLIDVLRIWFYSISN